MVSDFNWKHLWRGTPVERIVLLKLRLQALGPIDRDLEHFIIVGHLRARDDLLFHHALVSVTICGETLSEFLFFLRSSTILLQDDHHFANVCVFLVDRRLAAHFDNFADLVL